MDKFTTYRQSLRMAGARIDVLIETGPFEPKGHRFGHDAAGDVTIDGLRARGTDSTPPKAQNCVRRFEVRWNGKRVPIADRHWKHLLDVFPTKAQRSDDDKGTVYLLPADDGRAILLAIAGGGDGAGLFKTWWTIRQDGVAGVFTEGPP